MAIERIAVFLPCHSLEDFPTWLDEADASDLLAAWTAAWDPRLIAAVGRAPTWASAEVPPHDGTALLGIVPPACDERIAASLAATVTPGSVWVRQTRGREAIVAAAVAALGIGSAPPAPLAEDFHALGLAWLLMELLSRRMRSGSALAGSGLDDAVLAAARAAVAGDEAEAQARLGEGFATLAAARGHYYPVDVWLLDLVLLAETTLGPRLAAEFDSPTPWTAVATGDLLRHLAASDPPLAARLREAVAAGRIAPAGGRDDDEPLDGWAPETILASFLRGRRAWQEVVGAAPQCFARVGGGTHPLLPQVLAQLGYAGAVWQQFDGTTLPDPGASRLRWQGGGGTVEAVAKPPLDARVAATILRLPERLGDAMDHDHTAVLTFAHHAGTASEWFWLLRRIGSWTTALGTFVLPEEFFRRTAGAGGAVSLEPDSYPPVLPPAATIPAALAARLAGARDEAGRLAADRRALGELLAPASAPRRPAERSGAARGPGGVAGWFRRRSSSDRTILEGNGIRVRVHPQTGGMLSLRRSGERGNRLTQQLALRTTKPPPPTGAAWEDPLERARYTTMVAESITRLSPGAIESRGRLDRDRRTVGRFVQRLELDPQLPLVRLAVTVEGLAAEPSVAETERFASYACCRFAWNENDDVDLRRSQATQSVITERTLLSAPHFLEITEAAAPAGSGATILTGGLPWHLRSSPHMLDCILPAGAQVEASLAVGIGLDHGSDLGVAFAADPAAALGAPAGNVPANVRLSVIEPVADGGRREGIVVGIVETAGRGGDVTLEWANPPAAARLCDALGRPVDDRVEVAGTRTTFHLRRYGWSLLELRFPEPAPAPEVR
ncbi:MAG: hypothetical protein KGQ61_05285 [Planctomycetes bacterium]|nr:hypothetical protein [Planctomycetota bacterium]